MRAHLRRFGRLIATDELPQLLVDDSSYETEDLGVEVDLSACLAQVAELRRAQERGGRSRGPEADAGLARPLVEMLGSALPGRHATDMRVWHWLCTSTQLREFIWLRWHGLVPSDAAEALTQSGLASRFLGSNSINGQMRNALARIFLTVLTLSDGIDDRERGIGLAEAALRNTDLHLQLFEREFSLHPPIARAAVEVLQGWSGDDLRPRLMRLNRLGTTRPLELLSESEAKELLSAP